MGDGKDVCRAVARWSGFVGSVLVFVLGIVHLTSSEAELKWPDKFTDDVNKVYWRRRLFTFIPDLFADLWTPFFMGGFGALFHFAKLKYEPIMKSFSTYFVFIFAMAMFGSIGYNGGLGILFSVPLYLSALMSLIMYFWEDASASLELDGRFRSGAK